MKEQHHRVTIPVKNCFTIPHASEITLLILSFTVIHVIKCSFESHNRKKQKKKKNTKTSETISDSAECYAGLSVRFESSAACM